MADDQEKTEEPTSKKIEDARKKGNVAKSQDATGVATLVVGLAVLLFLFENAGERLNYLYIHYGTFYGTELTNRNIFDIALVTIREMVFIILPLAVAVAIAGVLGTVMQIGWLFAPEAAKPDIKKIDPIKGLKNLISIKKLVESLKIVLKVGVVFGLAFYFLLDFLKELPLVTLFNFFDQLLWLRDKAIILVAVMVTAFAMLAILDISIVRYQYFKGLRMSKQEVKDEYKQMEGSPEVKSRIRRTQMEMSKKRMMQDIPSADVVITNPTHYAVAIRYNQDKENAPRIVAKGVDNLALRIKQIAYEYDIQVVENPPLARELYKKCNIDQEIPASLYKAVAEVLAYVYKVNQEKRSSN
jgi:flagellar biosynthetic protein FlhB